MYNVTVKKILSTSKLRPSAGRNRAGMAGCGRKRPYQQLLRETDHHVTLHS